MSADKAFVDTNILVYMFDDDLTKRSDVFDTLRNFNSIINVQVAMEFCSVCTRKLHFDAERTRSALAEIRQYCAMRPVTAATIDRALDVQARYGYSFYDSVMVASALEHGCRYLLSEDMKHRQTIEGTMIINIFAE